MLLDEEIEAVSRCKTPFWRQIVDRRDARAALDSRWDHKAKLPAAPKPGFVALIAGILDP